MTRLLIEKETIYAEEVNMIMRGETFEAIVDFLEKNAEKQRLDPFHLGDKPTDNH